VKFAYADPPYIGQAKKHYGCEEIDHPELIERLEKYDGWALSLSSPTLKEILNMCPDDVRVAAWVKPFASFKPNVNPAYAWEPIIFKTSVKRERDELTVRDWVSANITLQRGTHGAKPLEFCIWIFQLLGMKEEDKFDDLFYGSGAVTKAWEMWRKQIKMFT